MDVNEGISEFLNKGAVIPLKAVVSSTSNPKNMKVGCPSRGEKLKKKRKTLRLYGLFSSDKALPTPAESPKFSWETKSERNINEAQICRKHIQRIVIFKKQHPRTW